MSQNCVLAGTVGWTYAAAGWKNCSNPPSGDPRTPSETDWTNAEPKLNVDGAIAPIIIVVGLSRSMFLLFNLFNNRLRQPLQL
ncbi:MAG: hypothetical protein IPJ05_04935 [Nitrosomonas sp.]|nr:hypothetical protein [Nitrosomonas sp.]